MPPVLIDLEDPFKEEDEENTVAPQMMLSSNGNSATDMNLITFPATSAVDVSPTLRIGVWASNDLGGGAWMPLDELPAVDRGAIHAKSNRDYIFHAKIWTMYRSITRSAERFIQRGMCVNNYLYHGVAASKYTAVEGDKDKACDHCNGRSRLCVTVIVDAVGPKLLCFHFARFLP